MKKRHILVLLAAVPVLYLASMERVDRRNLFGLHTDYVRLSWPTGECVMVERLDNGFYLPPVRVESMWDAIYVAERLDWRLDNVSDDGKACELHRAKGPGKSRVRLVPATREQSRLAERIFQERE